VARRSASVAASAQAKIETAAKVEAFQELKDLMKSNLRYAESRHKRDDAQLQYLGWGARRPRTPRTAPGAVRLLVMAAETEHGVTMTWKKPADGGPVAAYKVQRRRRHQGDWADVGATTDRTITLENQERASSSSTGSSPSTGRARAGPVTWCGQFCDSAPGLLEGV